VVTPSNHAQDEPGPIIHRRSAKRRRVLKGGWLVLADGTSSIRCFVKDISSTGARIQTTDTGAMPEGHLKLTLSDGETLNAEVVRRSGQELGIRFVSDRRPSLAPPPDPVEQVIEQMEAMCIEDILTRLDSLGLTADDDVKAAATAFEAAYTALHARLTTKVGPW